MTSANSKTAGKPYEGETPRGRKSSDGSESTVKVETLKTRLPDLVSLKIAAIEAGQKYAKAAKAVAEASGTLSVTVNRIVRSKVNNSFIEDREKARQMVFAFDHCGEFDDDETEKESATGSPESAAGNAQAPLDNSPVSNPVESAAEAKEGGRRRGNGAIHAPE